VKATLGPSVNVSSGAVLGVSVDADLIATAGNVGRNGDIDGVGLGGAQADLALGRPCNREPRRRRPPTGLDVQADPERPADHVGDAHR